MGVEIRPGSRFEFRVFSPDPEAWATIEKALASSVPRTGRELYLVGEDAETNRKIRNGLLETKVLARRLGGLERWEAAEKKPVLPDEKWPEGLVPVYVEKTRFQGTLAGCRTEFARVTANGAALFTAACEDEDPEKVTRARVELGLLEAENVSYPRMFRRLLGLEPIPGAEHWMTEEHDHG